MFKGRPDFSNYVAHFTKDAPPIVEGASATPIVGNAFERLINILTTRTIVATPMPWTKRAAVAFTECPWGSLLDHSRRYSPFGIGFSKGRIFAAGGNPAIYLRPDLTEKQQQEYRHKDNPDQRGFHPHLWAFVTPFVPEYAAQTFFDNYWGMSRSLLK
jgi:Putative abortive phage resistance protein AbiGi, antitoxin